MERTKNIKIIGIPSYAKEMGKGMFVGGIGVWTMFICLKCKKTRKALAGTNQMCCGQFMLEQ